MVRQRNKYWRYFNRAKWQTNHQQRFDIASDRLVSSFSQKTARRRLLFCLPLSRILVQTAQRGTWNLNVKSKRENVACKRANLFRERANVANEFWFLSRILVQMPDCAACNVAIKADPQCATCNPRLRHDLRSTFDKGIDHRRGVLLIIDEAWNCRIPPLTVSDDLTGEGTDMEIIRQ